jgi:DNA invertase Pin-like site-specific DNA recombinase
MTNFAYLRVSTDQQDTKNQKFGILDYCNKNNLSPIKFIEDTASGKVAWQNRIIGQIMEKANNGDLIVVSEISRLGRSTLQVLEILETAAKKEISVHIAKNHIVIDGSMQSTITATVLGLAAQIEREFISSRTKEALAKRKAEGFNLGRPKGQSQLLKLDSFTEEIKGYLKKGINKRAISKLIECSPSTLYLWLKRRKLYTKTT